jgi:hypothetical protein
MANNKQLNWLDNAQEQLGPELLQQFEMVKSLYLAHRDEAKALPSYTLHKEAKEAFEAELSSMIDVPTGKVLVCSYLYGKLRITFADAPKSKSKAPKLTLEQWRNAQDKLGVSR